MRRQTWEHASRGAGVGFACVALLLTTASCLCGQDKSSAEGQAAASVQPAQRDYRFEVASIRPVALTGFPNIEAARAAQSFTPGRYREEQVSLARLAYQAFGLKYEYRMEHPGWMSTKYFTLNATTPEGATEADLPVMIQHLLEDRFGLKYHRDTRHMAGYELIVVKSMPGLTKSAGPAPDPSTLKGPGFELKNGGPALDKNGMPVFAKDARSVQLCFGAGCVWHERNQTMQALADELVARLQAPVKDATGLEGEYDYTLTFTPEAFRGNGVIVSPPPPSASASPTAGGAEVSAPMDHPLLRDALVEQLGLKLQPVKDVSVDVIVIDDAKREPTEN